MRILLVHNQYQVSGGEEAVFRQEGALLGQKGHEVFSETVSNDSIRSLRDKLRVALDAPCSKTYFEWMGARLRKHRPEIVHVHNFFPLLTPSIFYACQEARIPCVLTLHNFRIRCAQGSLLRDGKPCEDCLTGSPLQALLYGCYRESRIATLPVTRMIRQHWEKGTWTRVISKLLVMTEFARARLMTADLPESQMVVKPNFLPDPMIGDSPKRLPEAVFVGRLSEEKGIRLLLDAWKEIPIPLKVIGSGPMEGWAREHAPRSVRLLGTRSNSEVLREIASSSLLVLPSLCYENFPMVLLEAFSQGVPALVAGHGGMKEIVQDGITGFHFQPGKREDLILKMRKAFADSDHLKNLSTAARSCYERNYTPEKVYPILLGVYQEILGR